MKIFQGLTQVFEAVPPCKLEPLRDHIRSRKPVVSLLTSEFGRPCVDALIRIWEWTGIILRVSDCAKATEASPTEDPCHSSVQHCWSSHKTVVVPCRLLGQDDISPRVVWFCSFRWSYSRPTGECVERSLERRGNDTPSVLRYQT